MGTRFGINRSELARLLIEADGDVAVVRIAELDKETGMRFPGKELGDTITVEVDGTPDQIAKLFERIDPNHEAPKPRGWFK